MIWEIKKEVEESGLELLPDIFDTELCDFYEGTIGCSKIQRQIALLYDALQKRENYFQLNSPTAFGNPQYNFFQGTVFGILFALDAEESHTNDKIVITRRGKKLLIIDKVNKPKSFYEERKDLQETMKNLFG